MYYGHFEITEMKKGSQHSKETKTKMSLVRTGRKPGYWLGKHRSIGKKFYQKLYSKE